MKYLIFGMAALLAGECALAQTTAPATAPGEPAKKDAVTQPAPAAAPGQRPTHFSFAIAPSRTYVL